MSSYGPEITSKLPASGALGSSFKPAVSKPVGGDAPRADEAKAFEALVSAFRTSAETATFGEKQSLVEKYARNAAKEEAMKGARSNFGNERAMQMFAQALVMVQSEASAAAPRPQPAASRPNQTLIV